MVYKILGTFNTISFQNKTSKITDYLYGSVRYALLYFFCLFSYRRGNDPHHFREEYLSQKAHNFKAKLRWGDAYEVSTFDLYNTLRPQKGLKPQYF